MNVVWSDQYGVACVVAGDSPAREVIDRCWEVGAVLHDDGEEFCVELRAEVGPELWTARALRGSLVS